MSSRTSVKLYVVILITMTFAFMPFVSLARSSKEVQDDIAKQQSLLKETQDKLNKAEKQYNESKTSLSNAEEGLPKIEAELKQIESEIVYNSLKLKVLEEKKNLKELEKIDREAKQEESLEASYMSWRVTNPIVSSIVETQYDHKRTSQYGAVVLDEERDSIYSLADTLDNLALEIETYKQELANLEKKNEELKQRKIALENQIAYYNSILNNSYSSIYSLQSTAQNIEEQLTNLTKEQQDAFTYESWILSQQNQVPPSTPQDTPPASGGTTAQSFYFGGVGRDLYQGHGVGMSQWGAYGMALNGYSYSNILTYYYTGVTLTPGYETFNLNVSGYGLLNIEDYVSGLGEIPDKACGTTSQVESNPAKYVVDNPNTSWDCWPEETIKAQIIAARTYAIHYVWYKSPSICTSAACQVYVGGNGKRWASDETKGIVLTYGGNMIEALYSSDNNQGHGTANNDTIFQSFWGDGTAYPYLRAVNDNALAQHTSWTNWSYSTNRYSYSDFDAFLAFTAGPSSSYNSTIRSYVQDIINSIGSITNISFERDPSLRVKKVFLTGSTGQTKSIGGWWWKNAWNSWVYAQGTNDYIYSQTFYLNQ